MDSAHKHNLTSEVPNHPLPPADVDVSCVFYMGDTQVQG
jgi:hypothetical protein